MAELTDPKGRYSPVRADRQDWLDAQCVSWPWRDAGGTTLADYLLALDDWDLFLIAGAGTLKNHDVARHFNAGLYEVSRAAQAVERAKGMKPRGEA